MTAKLYVKCGKLKKEYLKDKEIFKDNKENWKDFKDSHKELLKDKYKDKLKDKSEKEIYEKPGDKLGDGRPGEYGRTTFSLEERIQQLEERVNSFVEPFIGQVLRPDLSQGAFLNEEGYNPESGETGTIMSGHEKVQFDTR